MNIQDALKELYIAMGGKTEDVDGLTTTPDIINAFSELIRKMGGVAFNTIKEEE